VGDVSYAEFLARKAVRAHAAGIVPPALNERLFQFQNHVAGWALRQGRAAVFAGCGLGKSWIAIDWSRVVSESAKRPVLILTALAVAQQFVREGALMGIQVTHIRECPGKPAPGIYVANYEVLHKLESMVSGLTGVVLDESSILKNFDGKTRSALITMFRDTPYRLCCTATPSPNDPTELGNHAEFLGYMRHIDMLQRFFEHDAGDTGTWVLKGHGRRPFWQWVSGWAMCLNKPSDIGFSDKGYDLPPLEMHEHVVDVDQGLAHQAGLLFAYEAKTLNEQRAVRRATLAARVERAAALVAAEPNEQWLIWAGLNCESTALVNAIQGAVEMTGSDSAETKERIISQFIAGDTRYLVTKKSICAFGLNLQGCARQLDVGVDHSFEATYQAIRRSFRFGQKRPVHFHQICTSADGRVVANMQRKRLEFERMHAEMAAVIKGHS
jgi:hypothetical protein